MHGSLMGSVPTFPLSMGGGRGSRLHSFTPLTARLPPQLPGPAAGEVGSPPPSPRLPQVADWRDGPLSIASKARKVAASARPATPLAVGYSGNTRAAMSSPIARAAVAAGDGAFKT
jgi:hypothetical protein